MGVLLGDFRLFARLSSWAMWMSDLDCYALLVAAMAHDVGHPGRTLVSQMMRTGQSIISLAQWDCVTLRTNQFLVETSHELALRYNDTSPLEQMHCSKCSLHTVSNKTLGLVVQPRKDQ
eukprot:1988265-Amphidinium_carterae.1